MKFKVVVIVLKEWFEVNSYLILKEVDKKLSRAEEDSEASEGECDM